MFCAKNNDNFSLWFIEIFTKENELNMEYLFNFNSKKCGSITRQLFSSVSIFNLSKLNKIAHLNR